MVVIGGLSLAVAAALCTIVIEPEAEPARRIEHPPFLRRAGRVRGRGSDFSRR